ncbi:hypothetical protein [Motilimonas pumila]|uniref:Uncharacterized protein n=1 Tax=Motilimonas pumila TaxID=2303987 RepID=A0A418YDX4_9GAMM|nr:hypothetical protein [Motilimonas pumila]RJG42732.1 hypothetical protein D1Z90_11620 [Motilimonas pumila]
MKPNIVLNIGYVFGFFMVATLVFGDYQTLNPERSSSLRQYDIPPKFEQNNYQKPTSNLFVANRQWGEADDKAPKVETKPVKKKVDPTKWYLRAIAMQQGEYVAWIERPGLKPKFKGYKAGEKLPDGQVIKAVNKHDLALSGAKPGKSESNKLFPIK